jgi:hypothetical protein
MFQVENFAQIYWPNECTLKTQIFFVYRIVKKILYKLNALEKNCFQNIPKKMITVVVN